MSDRKGTNEVHISGEVSTDVRQFGGKDGKKAVLSFQLKVNPGTFNIKVWEPKAAISKGDMIEIMEARLSNRSYEKDGRDVWVTEIVTDGLHVMPLPDEEDDGDDLSFS